jgi:hypothetical protein
MQPHFNGVIIAERAYENPLEAGGSKVLLHRLESITITLENRE